MTAPRVLFLTHIVVGMTILSMIAVGGCKKDDPGIVNPPGGGGGGGGTLTDSLRFVALAAFKAFREGLDYTNPTAYFQILQYFRSHPETYEASDTAGPKSIWARFKDGRIFIVSDDSEFHPDTTAPSLHASGPPMHMRAGLNKLPSSAQARFLNALGPGFDPIGGVPGGTSTVQDLRNWYSAVGYSTSPAGDASVDGLKQVRGGDGVFYLSSHGSWGNTRRQPNGDSTEYGIWTTDEVTPANDARFAADLNSIPPRLCWYSARDNNRIFGNNFPVHYAITGQFVRDYMSFATNSLVFINACRSVQWDFRPACIEKGAGVYVGWTNNIDVWQGLKAGRFFLDRLIGANHQSPAENPPQRPFEITYVLEDMLLRNMDSHVGNKGPTWLTATPPYGWGGEPTLLAPSIEWAIPPFIQGDVNLLIDGSFGDNPGSGGVVTLGGNTLPVTWSTTRLECPAPASGGNLVVRVRGVKSNTIQLTEWHAQFIIVFRGVQNGPDVRGTLEHRVTLNLNFWSDIHSWRVLPNKPTNFWRQRNFYVMPNSTCQFASTGEYRSTLDTNIVIESWSAAITPQLSHWFTETTYFGLEGLIDSVGRQSPLNVRFRGEFTRTLRGSSSQDYFTPPSEMTQVIAALTSGYVFPGNSLPWSSGEFSGSMTWSAIVSQYPPDPSGGW